MHLMVELVLSFVSLFLLLLHTFVYKGTKTTIGSTTLRPKKTLSETYMQLTSGILTATSVSIEKYFPEEGTIPSGTKIHCQNVSY